MINEIISNWKLAQDAGAVLPCPRCGGQSMDEKIVRNALSRRAGIYICSRCLTEEALEDIPYSKTAKEKSVRVPLSRWWVFENVFNKVSTDTVEEDVFNVNISIDVKISKETIDDIMVAALEGGINYWCSKVEVVGEYLGEYASEQISRGGSLKLYDCESDDVYVLDTVNFLTGLKLALEKGYGHSRYGTWIYEGGIDAGEIDSTSADVIVQYALFGEIVYG